MSMWHERQTMIDRIIDVYFGSVTDARAAYMNDAQYHAQIGYLRQMLEVFDLAMKQEKISAETRISVLERIIMAAPDPVEAKKRIQLANQLIARVPPWWGIGKEK